ncbi:MAG: hypothetical protein Q9160_004116 [Pyrenula sp. 1 TL-2023]
MGWKGLSQLQRGTGIHNTTEPGDFAHLPPTLLNAFIPGYDVISKIVWDSFGFDVSTIVSLCIILFLLNTGFGYVYRYSKAVFEKHFTASITVDYYDDIYDHILAWIADLKALKSTRSLRAQSGVESAWEGFDGDELKANTELSDGEYFNFHNWEAKVPPRFEPHGGSNWFWHKGHYIQFRRDKETIVGGLMKGMLMDQEKIVLTVLGRSTQPLKELIIEARDRYLSRESARTVVRRPSPREQRGRGRQAWTRVCTRPSRPMSTVVLDKQQKDAILRDINEYLHPATPRWYSERGIPYRRGYLFHGPPGTGKTSLSFAIAGVFGLDIYCISLLEPTLTEEDLGLLFNSLPRRCVVLLEDIDSAGLHRKKTEAEQESEDAENAKKEHQTGEENSSAIIAKEVAKVFKNVNDQNARRNKQMPGQNTDGISLSGLLNAIDGVASHEGRVLVMTTNFVNKLDDALIRPGRVDLKIEFTKATNEQIRQLYLRMYYSDRNGAQSSTTILANPVSPRSATPSAAFSHNEKVDKLTSVNGRTFKSLPINIQRMLPSSLLSKPPTPPETPPPISGQIQFRETFPTSPQSGLPKIDTESQDSVGIDLEALATSFAALLPSNTFSPAEIQGFLLTRKKDPEGAVREVVAWRDNLLANRDKAVKGAAVDVNSGALGGNTVKSTVKAGAKSTDVVESGAEEPAAPQSGTNALVGRGAEPEAEVDQDDSTETEGESTAESSTASTEGSEDTTE